MAKRFRSNAHTHTCETPGCKVEVACGGSLEQNYDGWPEVICDAFHVDHRPSFHCEKCEEKAAVAHTLECTGCGDPQRIGGIGTLCRDCTDDLTDTALSLYLHSL
jgi:hypothetical protein